MQVTCAAAAQILKIEGRCVLHASKMCWEVVKRDLRFRTRIQMLSNSSGAEIRPRYGFDGFAAVFATG